MERRENVISILIGAGIAIIGYKFNLDYMKIAEQGITLSSIVLAVYIAAIIGLVNTNLVEKMKKNIASNRNDKTQLGVLVLYFKNAILCAFATILISTIILLLPNCGISNYVFRLAYRLISILGMVFYVENLVFFSFVVRFILNRQIWNT